MVFHGSVCILPSTLPRRKTHRPRRDWLLFLHCAITLPAHILVYNRVGAHVIPDCPPQHHVRCSSLPRPRLPLSALRGSREEEGPRRAAAAARKVALVLLLRSTQCSESSGFCTTHTWKVQGSVPHIHKKFRVQFGKFRVMSRTCTESSGFWTLLSTQCWASAESSGFCTSSGECKCVESSGVWTCERVYPRLRGRVRLGVWSSHAIVELARNLKKKKRKKTTGQS